MDVGCFGRWRRVKPKPNTHLQISAAALAVGAVLLGGCGSSAPQITAPVETLIEFESEWQCEVTRFSFESAADLVAKRDDIRTSYGVSGEDHVTFVEMLTDDADLRAVVAALVDTTCPVDDEDSA